MKNVKNKLIYKLIFYIIICSSVITVLVSGLQLYLDYQEEVYSIEVRSEQIKKSHLPAIVNQLWVGDFDIMNVQLEGILQLPYVQYIKVDPQDSDSIFVGSYKSDYTMEYSFEMHYLDKENDYVIGDFYLQFDLEQIRNKLFDEFFIILRAVLIVIALVSLFLFFIFQRLIMRHLLSISEYIKTLSIDNLSNTLKLQRDEQSNPDELQEVVNGLNEMRINLLNETRKITELNTAFARFVPEDFINHLGKKSILDLNLGDGVEGDMAILFSDLKSFTNLSEGLTPEESFQFLNEYLGEMNPAIKDNNGFIDKYIGDSIMALFDQDVDDALKASIEMLKRVHQMNRDSKGDCSKNIEVRIGIHYGKMMLGTIGSKQRMETTVISDAVNVAARIEGFNKMYGTSILVSEDVLNNLKHPDQFSIRFVDYVKPKGKDIAIRFFEIFDGDTPTNYSKKGEIRDKFEEGTELYFSKKFKDAKLCFEWCEKIFPEDVPTQKYLDRCDYYLENGLEDDWDGITRLRKK